MKPMDRLLFHLREGALRRWSMWHESEFPTWAAKEGGASQERYDFFSAMKGGVRTEFEYWPYWLVIDLYMHVLGDNPFENEGLLREPDNLLEAVCDVLDDRYSQSESQVRSPMSHGL